VNISAIPIIDLAADSPDAAQQAITRGATTVGCVFLRNLPMRADFAAIQRLFDTLYQTPHISSRLEEFGVFQRSGKWAGDDFIDDKASLGLGARKLWGMKDYPLKRFLGADFESVVNFYEAMEESLIPWVLQSTSNVISNVTGHEVDMFDIHHEGHYNLRLLDYHRSSSTPRLGAREHRDLSMATIIFQDGAGGLEIQDPATGEWLPVPPNETVLMWGNCGMVLSGGRINAANHRVNAIPSHRRNSAVCFISPDKDTVLQPLIPDPSGSTREIINRVLPPFLQGQRGFGRGMMNAGAHPHLQGQRGFGRGLMNAGAHPHPQGQRGFGRGPMNAGLQPNTQSQNGFGQGTMNEVQHPYVQGQHGLGRGMMNQGITVGAFQDIMNQHRKRKQANRNPNNLA
jgi:2OG-Fe(II) oxygenase superfamily